MIVVHMQCDCGVCDEIIEMSVDNDTIVGRLSGICICGHESSPVRYKLNDGKEFEIDSSGNWCPIKNGNPILR